MVSGGIRERFVGRELDHVQTVCPSPRRSPRRGEQEATLRRSLFRQAHASTTTFALIQGWGVQKYSNSPTSSKVYDQLSSG